MDMTCSKEKKGMPPVYFYIPPEEEDNGLPSTASDYWPWRVGMAKRYPFMGRFNWTLQTFLRLRDDGFPVELTDTPFKEGIVISHQQFLSDVGKPPGQTLLVCLKGDNPENPYAQVHVVQNHMDMMDRRGGGIPASYYIPHWPQQGILPRDPARGGKFENIAYYGNENQLAEEFKSPSWARSMKEAGFKWIMRTSSGEWSDYRDIDALVAIRKTGARSYGFRDKPATKLYNAWHAGIPAVMGKESSYRFERKSELDYIEANSPEEVVEELIRLREDPELRRKMADNGKVRAVETDPDEILGQWKYFIEGPAAEAYHMWKNPAFTREAYFLKCEARKHALNARRWVLRMARKIYRRITGGD